MAPDSEARPPRRWKRMLLWIGAATLALGAVAVGWIAVQQYAVAPSGRNLPGDPRVAYTGPFQNIHPDVKYVGSKECARCHSDKAETYARHPMARTLMPTAELAPAQSYGQDHNNPFKALNSLFTVVRKGGRVWHRQSGLGKNTDPALDVETEVHYAVGSGSHGHSYITDRDGYLLQTSISWFAQKNKWDLSPAFTEQVPDRPISGDCFFCHSNRALSLDYYLNRYEKPVFPGEHGIGCERCHGPGEKHIHEPGNWIAIHKQAELGPGNRMDPTIVNPAAAKKLSPELCEAICQQCHLPGEARILPRGRSLYDFRPGMPLESAWSIFVYARKDGAKWKAVNHVDQMYLSKCFEKTTGNDKLGCISCHDPHKHIGPAERTDYYRQRCLSCHAEKPQSKQVGCSVPVAQREKGTEKNSCIACHMQRYHATDIVHNASTDHRILRAPQPALPDRPATEPRLALFGHGEVDPDNKELARDLGLAMVDRGFGYDDKAFLLLEAALKNDPEDIPAWERKGVALAQRDFRRQSLTAFETLLTKVPHHEMALAQAGAMSQATGQLDKAISYLRRTREVNPWRTVYARNLADLLASKGDWPEAAEECRNWLKLDPRSVDARKLLVECLLRQGNAKEARAEFAHIEALEPANLDKLQAWFKEKGK